MSAATVMTPSMVLVAEAAEAAINEPDGISYDFEASPDAWGDLTAAHKAARAFEVSFASVRARARRVARKNAGEHLNVRDGDALGRFDRLMCFMSALPDQTGYRVTIAKGAHLYDLVTVRNARTGEVMNPGVITGQKTTDEARADRVTDAMFGDQSKLTEEDARWFWETNPEREGTWELAKLPRPGWGDEVMAARDAARDAEIDARPVDDPA